MKYLIPFKEWLNNKFNYKYCSTCKTYKFGVKPRKWILENNSIMCSRVDYCFHCYLYLTEIFNKALKK